MPVHEALLRAYLAHLTLAAYRPSTVNARRDVLTAFAASIAPLSLLKATRHDVQAYLARPLAAESRRAYRSHLIGFYRWLVDEGELAESPMARVPPIRVKAGTPRPLSEVDLRDALAGADPRMRAWLLLMALAGLRCLEVAALQPADVLEVNGSVVLFLREVKGGGTSTMPAHPDVLAALAVLPIVDGRFWSVTPKTVSRNVSAYLHGLGIQASAHQLRHSAGTAWLRASGHDLLTTSRLLRHASVATTQVYARLDEERPAEVVSAVRLRAV